MKFFKDLFYLFFFTRRLMIKPVLRSKEICVLIYHSIGKNKWYASVNPIAFRMQMRYLRKHYNVVPLDDIVKYKQGEINLPDKSVAITFDDGYADNYKVAWPILKRNNLPFTIFVTTNLDNLDTLNNHFSRITWEQLKEMSDNGVDIGGHGVNHTDLNALFEKQLEEEVENCYQTLAKQLGKPAKNFSYPGGKYDEKVIEAVKKAGFKSACTTKEGMVKKSDNVFEIKRVWVHRGLGFMSFLIRLTMVTDWITIFKNRRKFR